MVFYVRMLREIWGSYKNEENIIIGYLGNTIFFFIYRFSFGYYTSDMDLRWIESHQGK